MQSTVYTIELINDADFVEAQELLTCARIAACGLHSDSSLRIDAHNWHDESARSLLIDASTGPGQTVLRIFSSLLDHELGADRYSLMPTSKAQVQKVDSWKRGEYAR